MTIAWGSALSKTHFDADTDDPSQARAELEAMVDRINTKLANQTLLQLSDKTGNDAGIVSGTAGTNGNLVQWNADGDAVDGPDVLSAISSGTDTDVVSKGAVQGAGVAALVPLAQATASDDAAIDFTSNIDGTYDEYVFEITGMRLASASNKLQLRVSSDGGSTWDSGSTDYSYATQGNRSDGTGQSANSNGATVIDLMEPTPGSADTNKSTNIRLRLSDPSNSSHVTSVDWVATTFDDNSRTNHLDGSGHRRNPSGVNAIRFRGSGVNIAAGEFRLYGVKKS